VPIEEEEEENDVYWARAAEFKICMKGQAVSY
jgi:hypothetical protein